MGARVGAPAVLLASAVFLAGCMPPGPRAFFDGKRHLEKGDPSGAVESFTLATSILPTNALVWHYLGLAFQEAGRTAEAQTAYGRALALDRDLTEAHYNLGCLWLEQNNNNPGRLDLDRAKAEFTSFTLRRPDSIDGLVKLGTVQLRLRELPVAEKSLTAALRLSPTNVEALNGLGVLRVHRGRPGDAAQPFAAALKQTPRYAPALLNLAVLDHQYLHNPQAALDRYKQYIALKPTPANTHAVAPVVRQLEKELAGETRIATTQPPAVPPARPAESRGSKPAATNPVSVAQAGPVAGLKPQTSTPPADVLITPEPMKSADAAKPLAGVRPSTLSPSPSPQSTPPVETAKVAPDPVIKAADDSAPAMGPRYSYSSPPRPAPGNRRAAEKAFAEGVQSQNRQRLAEAQAAYVRAVQLDPTFFKAHYNLALVQTDSGNTGAAMRQYEIALAIQPDSLDARYNFGLLLKQAGFHADAVRELEKVAAVPNQARAHLALGNLYAQQLDEPAAARAHYAKVLELDPRHPQAGAIRYWLTANPK